MFKANSKMATQRPTFIFYSTEFEVARDMRV